MPCRPLPTKSRAHLLHPLTPLALDSSSKCVASSVLSLVRTFYYMSIPSAYLQIIHGFTRSKEKTCIEKRRPKSPNSPACLKPPQVPFACRFFLRTGIQTAC